jgi:hypothetical protein
MNESVKRSATTTIDMESVNILDTTATPLYNRRSSMTGKSYHKQGPNRSLAFGKKKKGSQAKGGEKEVRYNFKGQEKFANAAKCFICDKKFGMSSKRHHW